MAPGFGSEKRPLMLRRAARSKPLHRGSLLLFGGLAAARVFFEIPGEDSLVAELGMVAFSALNVYLTYLNRPGFGYNSPPPPTGSPLRPAGPC